MRHQTKLHIQKKLYIRADDFGMSPGTNEAIIDGIDCGTIQNVGVLTPGRYVTYCLDALIERQDVVCIGLHFALNSEWTSLRWGPIAPADQVPSLLYKDGHFHFTTQQTDEQAQLSEIEIELKAQLAFARSLGLNPRYLDTHMGVSWIPAIFTLLEAFCESEELIFVDALKASRFKTENDQDWSLLPLHNALDLITPISASELIWIFHPAYADTISYQFGSNVAERREREAKLLIDPEFNPTLKLNHRSLARFDQ
jgi:predicted glycoside hydrolase/deacetylase ChbG (UPF0249 family)